VVGISVDDLDTLRRFKAKTKALFPLLSDPGGKVSSQYAGLMPVVKFAKRANVVVGEDGIVKEVVTGGDAVDPSSAIGACPRREAGGS
jgi:thioredoxin-dependent peroxiredoxin